MSEQRSLAVALLVIALPIAAFALSDAAGLVDKVRRYFKDG